MPAASVHALVIRRRYLGDVVLLGSVLRNLRLHWPDATLSVLTEAAYADVLALNPDVNRALTFPRGLGEWPGFIRALRAAGITHVLDFDNTDKTALVSRLTGAAVRVTFDRETNPFRHRWAYTGAAKVTNAFYTSEHITETYLSLLAPASVPVATREVRLVTRPADLAAVQPFVGLPKSEIKNSRFRRVLVHPGSRSAFRLWPAERFAAVCDQLQDGLGAQVFIVSGPGEQALVKEIRGLAQTHLVALEQRFTVGQFAALLTQFDVLLCHDSGPMHVAAAVGTPVVALFGSQNVAIWHPLGERHVVLQTPLPCQCLGAAAPGPCVPTDSYRSYCVRKLEVPQVFEAVKATLALGGGASAGR
ncbi:MAG TPA: glycosyltransferase family 9 protein [Opitutaceae bacterium]|nr:glycosyltransferase family 9 protein [Opitutaceae bacterium]HND61131.1 glycosyltransferase family 9 protein [Opitutaceae bacterium]